MDKQVTSVFFKSTNNVHRRALYWTYSVFFHCYSKIHSNVKCVPFIQSTTWLVDHLLTGSMTRAIVEVFADGAKQRCERSASAHSRTTHADFCLFFIRCMFTLQILPWFLKNEALVVFQVQSIALHSFALVFVRELSKQRQISLGLARGFILISIIFIHVAIPLQFSFLFPYIEPQKKNNGEFTQLFASSQAVTSKQQSARAPLAHTRMTRASSILASRWLWQMSRHEGQAAETSP